MSRPGLTLVLIVSAAALVAAAGYWDGYDSNRYNDDRNRYDDGRYHGDDDYFHDDDRNRHRDGRQYYDDNERHRYDEYYHRDDRRYHDNDRKGGDDDWYYEDDKKKDDDWRDDKKDDDWWYDDDKKDDNDWRDDKKDDNDWRDDKKDDDDWWYGDDKKDDDDWRDDKKDDDYDEDFMCRCHAAHGVLGYDGKSTQQCQIIHHKSTDTAFSFSRVYDGDVLFPLLDPAGTLPALRFRTQRGEAKCWWEHDRRPKWSQCYCSPAYDSACTHPHAWLNYFDYWNAAVEVNAFLSCEFPWISMPSVCELRGLHLRNGARATSRITWTREETARIDCQHDWWDLTFDNVVLERTGRMFGDIRTRYGSSGRLEAKTGNKCHDYDFCGGHDFF